MIDAKLPGLKSGMPVTRYDSRTSSAALRLRTREADLEKHLGNGQGEPQPPSEADKAAETQREQEREAARLRLEEEAKKHPGGRLRPEFGSDKDFQLQQALNQLKGKPVQASKTLSERDPAKDKAED